MPLRLLARNAKKKLLIASTPVATLSLSVLMTRSPFFPASCVRPSPAAQNALSHCECPSHRSSYSIGKRATIQVSTYTQQHLAALHSVSVVESLCVCPLQVPECLTWSRQQPQEKRRGSHLPYCRMQCNNPAGSPLLYASSREPGM